MGPAAQQADPWLDAAQDFRVPLVALVLLAGLAGYADAVALLTWDVFVANQSGNVVRTGMGLAGADTDWPAALVSIVAFGVGGAASSLVGRRPGRLVPPATRLLLAAAALVAWAAAVIAWQADGGLPFVPGVVLLAFAMGIIATTFVRLGGVQVTTTYATGAVLRVGQSSVAALGDPPAERARALRVVAVTVAMLLSYAGGGAVGTAAVHHLGVPWLAALALVLLATVGALLRRARHPGDASDRPPTPGPRS